MGHPWPCTSGIHTSKDLSVANSFAMAHNLTACESSASRAAAAFRTNALEATNVVAIWANSNWLCWKFARVLPNCFLTWICEWTCTHIIRYEGHPISDIVYLSEKLRDITLLKLVCWDKIRDSLEYEMAASQMQGHLDSIYTSNIIKGLFKSFKLMHYCWIHPRHATSS